MSKLADNKNQIIFGNNFISIRDIVEIAYQNKEAELSQDTGWRKKIQKGAEFLSRLLKEEGSIYGVTTGYGDSCTVAVPIDLVYELPLHLSRFHGCGMGNTLSVELSLAVLAVRLSSLSQGYSGVRLEILETLAQLINKKIAPVIPEEGSVGASGDLTPLSYVAAVLMGEREVFYKGKREETLSVFNKEGITPLKLVPKEGLALMNGTAVMTAMACAAYDRAEYLCRLASRITALTIIATDGNPCHFKENLFTVKPHMGQVKVAEFIRNDLYELPPSKEKNRLQDRYSLRCAPHVIGVLVDSLDWMKKFIETEINSANDNPIIDGEKEEILHGGHFYGGHIAFVMDSMKNAVANLADLMDRQLALLVDPKFNHGLPANLTAAKGKRASINHGFKAVQILVSALCAEALKLTMPASVFSRSTECHNQDKVSMGTIAARDCLRIIELTEQIAAAMLLAVIQGIDLRLETANDLNLKKHILNMKDSIREKFELVIEDRPMESSLRYFVELIRKKEWNLYNE
ncbi:MAG: aromatic amino acid ammonia-lyase [Spirochaetia bacterium]|nr:aromatic amino acid ammonia-lyase [Spirochaetia bacterium]